MVSREMREMSPMEFTHKFGEFPSREGLTILVVSASSGSECIFRIIMFGY